MQIDSAPSDGSVPIKQEEASHSSWQNFPNGLRVLVVDDDPLCLKVIEQMLRRCNYEGTSFTAACAGLLHSLSTSGPCCPLLQPAHHPPTLVVCLWDCSAHVRQWSSSAGTVAGQEPWLRPGAIRRVHARSGQQLGRHGALGQASTHSRCHQPCHSVLPCMTEGTA